MKYSTLDLELNDLREYNRPSLVSHSYSRSHPINKATDNLVLSFMVCENDKFIIVEDNEQDETVDIYCNLTKLMSISDYDCVVGDILYDEISGSWLVIYEFENNTKAVRINKYGNYEEIQMPEFIESRLYLHGNVLYYTKQDEISFYNVKKDTLNKKECEIATLDDRISIQGNKFVICNENGTYMYLKSWFLCKTWYNNTVTILNLN